MKRKPLLKRREENYVIYRGAEITATARFSWETMRTRQGWSNASEHGGRVSQSGSVSTPNVDRDRISLFGSHIRQLRDREVKKDQHDEGPGSHVLGV